MCERWILQNWWLLFILSEHFSWRNLLEDRFCFHEQHVSGLNLLLWTVPIVLWHCSNLFHVCMHKGGSEELEKAITTDSSSCFMQIEIRPYIPFCCIHPHASDLWLWRFLSEIFMIYSYICRITYIFMILSHEIVNTCTNILCNIGFSLILMPSLYSSSMYCNIYFSVLLRNMYLFNNDKCFFIHSKQFYKLLLWNTCSIRINLLFLRQYWGILWVFVFFFFKYTFHN